MSEKVFNALPQDIQKIMLDTAVECATFERNLLRDAEAKQICRIEGQRDAGDDSQQEAFPGCGRFGLQGV